MFLWITLPEGYNTTELLGRALERQVAFVPGGAFHANGGGENTMRLNFSFSNPAQIVEGVRRLSEVFKAALG
jgi:2-aminoadipate transaminase